MLQMRLMTEREARSLLEPIHHVLSSCPRRAFSKYMAKVRPTTPLPTRRMRANVVHNYMVDEARLMLGADPNITFIEKQNRSLISVHNKALLRFKKLDQEMRPRNYPTSEALAFDAQLGLPGVPDLARLTIGYALNRDEADIDGVYVLLTTDRKVQWMYSLDEAQATFTPLTLPLVPAANAAPQRSRIRPKAPPAADQKKPGEETG